MHQDHIIHAEYAVHINERHASVTCFLLRIKQDLVLTEALCLEMFNHIRLYSGLCYVKDCFHQPVKDRFHFGRKVKLLLKGLVVVNKVTTWSDT